MKNAKILSLQETGVSHKLVFFSKDNPFQNTLGKIKKSSKFIPKNIYICLCVLFEHQYQKFVSAEEAGH